MWWCWVLILILVLTGDFFQISGNFFCGILAGMLMSISPSVDLPAFAGFFTV